MSYPVLDFERNEPQRALLDNLCVLEPFIPEMDGWVSLPVRLVHTQGAGLALELGPYEVSGADIGRLRAALAAFDKAVTA